jgi:hypothetical protein
MQMTEPTSLADVPLPAPRAARLRRPGWRDPRLLLGLTLIGVSVLVGSWAVTSAGRTVPVLVARETLVPGTVLDRDLLLVHEVHLPEGTAAYLGAGDDLSGLVVTRPVGAGELVPAGAVGDGVGLGLRPVAVTSAVRPSDDVRVGAVVDLWLLPASRDADRAPEEVASGLTVSQVAEPTGAFAVGTGTTVHVLVPVADLPAVLGAVSSEGTVAVVPVPGGRR